MNAVPHAEVPLMPNDIPPPPDTLPSEPPSFIDEIWREAEDLTLFSQLGLPRCGCEVCSHSGRLCPADQDVLAAALADRGPRQ